MSKSFNCLHGTTIFIALWSILYSILQIVIFAWQTKYIRDRQWEFENRQIVHDGSIDGFQARFPGLYGILTETSERRHINALFALAITTLILAFAHLVLSSMLLFGSITERVSFVWPWFFSALPITVISIIYSILWWTGDVFGTQLTMSVAEFVVSLSINSICFVIVLLFFLHIRVNYEPMHKKEHLKVSFGSALPIKTLSRNGIRKLQSS